VQRQAKNSVALLRLPLDRPLSLGPGGAYPAANPTDGEQAMDDKLMSDAFQLFLKECPAHAKAWLAAVRGLAEASALDEKTATLAYLSVLAALRLDAGVPFHAAHARQAGATRDEVISAILVGLPAAGNAVTHALPAALQAYDRA
jgi:alkylhydroperoxidase/carboxymuconolactone decarboxylase family protein YurZ